MERRVEEMAVFSYDIADVVDKEIATAKMVKTQYFTAKVTNSVNDYVEDTGEDGEEFKSFHKVNWTEELKVALRKIFDDIHNGKFEDDEDDGV